MDAKFYSENMVARFEGGAVKQKSGNLYQIFVVSLDLQQDFSGIKEDLLAYANQFFA